MTDTRTPVRYAGTADLVDLLDRVVDRGVVVSGDIVISLAGIDLIYLDVRLLLIAVQTSLNQGREER
ncbi:MAG TPA: gas vesicle protein GvpJ [Micromonosporaceae bacterium]